MQQGNNTTDPEINFGEFEAATYADWRKAAEAVLKGADFNRSLLTKLVEGITLQPIYNAEDVVIEETTPGQFPYRRGVSELGYSQKPWEVAQSIPATNPTEFNEALLHDLQRGQTAVNIQLNCKCGLALRTQGDWDVALNGVALDKMPVYITPGSCGLGVLGMYLNVYTSRGYDVANLKGGVLFDPIGKLVTKGSLCGGKGMCTAYDQMAEMTKWAIKNAPDFQTIGISGLPYHNSGASAVEGVGGLLATAVTYLRAMEERGISVDDAAKHMRFTIGVGSNIFMEIAKIRALRQLWAQIVKACGGSEESGKLKLHAATSSWTISKVDPWVNMLRGTAQAFSAVIGGVDSLDVVPFDSAVRVSDEFARRIARNVQLILQGECALDKVVDPAGGSWYIENLTDQAARRAWEIFQSIEKEGGMVKALKAGSVQKMINDTVAKRYELVDQRRQTLVGVNRYVNLQEKALEPTVECSAKAPHKPASDIETPAVECTVDSVRVAAESGLSTCLIQKALCAQAECKCGEPLSVEPLPARRNSERFERLLDKALVYQTANGNRPTVFFANMGPLRQHKARADFSQDFLRSGGFETIYPAGFETPEAAAEAAVASGCKACVICSTDDTYPELVPAFTKAVKAAKPDMMVILAGYPTDYVESFKADGVDLFIHVKANCYETLETIQNHLGL